MTTAGTIEWLALLRVHEGGLTTLDGRFLNHGQPVAGYLADAIEELIRTGHLALGRPDPIGIQQVSVTHSGQVRFAELAISSGVGEASHGGR